MPCAVLWMCCSTMAIESPCVVYMSRVTTTTIISGGGRQVPVYWMLLLIYLLFSIIALINRIFARILIHGSNN